MYTDQLCYVAGDTIRIHSNTTARTYDLVIYRDGATEAEVKSWRDSPGHFYEMPEDASVNGCGWPEALEVTVPTEWRSGGYIACISASQGGNRVEHHFLFAVRAVQPSQPHALLLVTCTATWVAYNDWGGSNFYEGIVGAGRNEASPVVSTLRRPFSRGWAT